MSLWDSYIKGGGFRPPAQPPSSAGKDELRAQLAEQLAAPIGGGMTGVDLPDVPDYASASNVLAFPGGRSGSSSSTTGGYLSGGGGGGGGGARKSSDTSSSTPAADWTSLVWVGAAIVGVAVVGSLVIRFVRG